MLVAVRARLGDVHAADRIAQRLRTAPAFMRNSSVHRMRRMVGVFSKAAVAGRPRMARRLIPR